MIGFVVPLKVLESLLSDIARLVLSVRILKLSVIIVWDNLPSSRLIAEPSIGARRNIKEFFSLIINSFFDQRQISCYLHSMRSHEYCNYFDV